MSADPAWWDAPWRTDAEVAAAGQLADQAVADGQIRPEDRDAWRDSILLRGQPAADRLRALPGTSQQDRAYAAVMAARGRG